MNEDGSRDGVLEPLLIDRNAPVLDQAVDLLHWKSATAFDFVGQVDPKAPYDCPFSGTVGRSAVAAAS